MVKDAQDNAEADQAFQDLAQAVNQAEQLIHGTEKALKDLGDDVDADQKSKAEAAIAELKTALEGKDKAEIEAKSEALSQVSGDIAQKPHQKPKAIIAIKQMLKVMGRPLMLSLTRLMITNNYKGASAPFCFMRI